MKLRINKIIKDSRANGPGTRYTIWVQGCSIHCKGCSNTDTWAFDGGEVWEISDLIKDIESLPVDGVTLTGGEPLDQYSAVYELLQRINPRFNTFVTSGYTLDRIQDRSSEILPYIDILVDGPYDENLIDNTPAWRGSTNQGIHRLSERSKSLPGPSFDAEIIISNGNATITGFNIPQGIL